MFLMLASVQKGRAEVAAGKGAFAAAVARVRGWFSGMRNRAMGATKKALS